MDQIDTMDISVHFLELGKAVSGTALQSIKLWEGWNGLAEIIKLAGK